MRVTWWLNVPAGVRAFRDVLGADPIDFYEWPETGERRAEDDPDA